MKIWGFTCRAAGLAVALAAFAGGTAQAAPKSTPAPAAPAAPAPPAAAAAPATAASTQSSTSACTPPNYLLSQPFTALGDNDYYTLAPGQSVDSFTGQGWTLTGGAEIVTATLADGTTGSVLELPAGATAVSPTMCVDSAFPTARLTLRDVVGPAGLKAYVAYTNTASATNPQPTNPIPGGAAWGVSPPVQLNPGNLAGWQLAQYTFTADNNTEVELYNFYVDPRGMV